MLVVDSHRLFLYCIVKQLVIEYLVDMSERNENNNLGSNLVYRSVSPLRWEVIDANLLTEQYVEGVCASNEAVMYAYAAVDGRQESRSDDGLHSVELHAEIGALDQKLNFLLDMVSELLFIHHELPAECAISLTSKTLEWSFSGEPVPEVGQQLSVKVYLSRVYMRPFHLHGVVDSVDKDSSVVKLSYHIASPSLRELLEKMIFRNHRRMIAHSRKKATKARTAVPVF